MKGYCVCDEKGPCLYHKEKNITKYMSNKENDVIEESIHYDLEQTIREARRESGMTLQSIAGILVEVLDPDEIKSLIAEMKYASGSTAVREEGTTKR